MAPIGLIEALDWSASYHLGFTSVQLLNFNNIFIFSGHLVLVNIHYRPVGVNLNAVKFRL